MPDSRHLTRAQASDLVYMGDTLLTIDECDKGRGVTAARVTRELGSDPDAIEYAVRKLLRGGYIEKAQEPGRYRLTVRGGCGWGHRRRPGHRWPGRKSGGDSGSPRVRRPV